MMPGFKIDAFVEDECRGDYAGKGKISKSEALHTIETARNHRYSLTILGFEEITAYVRSIDRPTYKPEHMVVHHGMQVINRPGKIAWEPLTVVFYETLSNDFKLNKAAEVIYGWFINDGYDTQQAPGAQTGNQIASKSKSIYNLQNNLIDHRNTKNIIIMMENGYGEPVWTYELKNAWPGTVEADTLDYTNNDISHIKMTVIYDRAVNVKGNQNAGI